MSAPFAIRSRLAAHARAPVRSLPRLAKPNVRVNRAAASLGTQLPRAVPRRNFSTLRSTPTAHKSKNKPLHILIIDGYLEAGRKNLNDGGASTAGDLYHKMLDKVSPVGITSDMVFPADPGFKAPDMSKYDGVAWTGCSLTIYHDVEEVTQQIRLAEHVYKLGIPSFGSCWSCQISAVAAPGGVCAKNPRGREMGLARKITLTPEGRAHPMFEGKPTTFDAYISHDDEVTHVPTGAQILAGNTWTRIQAMSTKYGGEFWSVQYHPEYDLHEYAMLLNCRIEKMTRLGYFRSHKDAEHMVQELSDLSKDTNRMDLKWKYGIDDDVLNDDIRLVEPRNWIKKLVMPYHVTRTGQWQ